MAAASTPTIDYLIDISRQAGKLIRDAYHRAKHVDCKVSAADLVTETDVAVERFLIERIASSFPTHKFLAEESSREDDQLSSDPTWVIDPIDAIAFAMDKEIRLACVFNPITDEMWYASLGNGAYYVPAEGSEAVKIHTSGKTELGDSLVSLGYNVPLLRSDQRDTNRNIITHTLGALLTLQCSASSSPIHRLVFRYNSRDIRRVGSAAIDLCYVAMGREDCYFELGIKEWDIAAGVLILSEAGGCYSLINGEKPDDLLHRRQILACASEALRTEMSSKLEYIDWWEGL